MCNVFKESRSENGTYLCQADNKRQRIVRHGTVWHGMTHSETRGRERRNVAVGMGSVAEL